MNAQVPATTAMSLPALLGGTGEDPGSEGVPVPAVSGNEAREYRGWDEALTLCVSPFQCIILCPIMKQEHIMGVYTVLLYC